MSTPASLPLLKGRITLAEALSSEDDMLERLSYPKKRLDFFCHLFDHRADIESIVSHHLGVPKASCRISEVEEWVHGSFNGCIPVRVGPDERVMIRFPLPYKVGESTHPGNAEEKIRCEAATYEWIRSHCPSVPIPRLRGFGLPDGPSVWMP